MEAEKASRANSLPRTSLRGIVNGAMEYGVSKLFSFEDEFNATIPAFRRCHPSDEDK